MVYPGSPALDGLDHDEVLKSKIIDLIFRFHNMSVVCMSHPHGKLAGSICPKLCTHIQLGPEIFKYFKKYFL